MVTTTAASSSNNIVSARAASVQSFKVMDVLERANALQAAGHRVLHCEVGQPGTGAPLGVAKAAREALTPKDDETPPAVLGYTDAFGLLELREKIARHYARYYFREDDNSGSDCLSIPTRRIVVTTGSSGAFLLAFTACFDAGDVVAVASSGYPCYRNILQALGCVVCTIPLNADFKLTAVELRAEVDRRRREREKGVDNDTTKPIKGLILSSPSNPTGAMLRPQELKALCELTDELDIRFLSDEIYHGISYGAVREATALEYSENSAVVINSFSKYYSMSGWRLGWMIVPDDLVPHINSLQQNMFINAPTISQTAALKCWDDDSLAELNGHVEKYRSSRACILEALARIPELNDGSSHIAPADGGFYVYVHLGEANVCTGSADEEHNFGSVRMCQALLEEKYVAFTPGVDFEDPASQLGDQRFRISYAQGVDVAKEAMERFHEFWPTWLERVRAAKGKV